jgi:hypothetical protein
LGLGGRVHLPSQFFSLSAGEVGAEENESAPRTVNRPDMIGARRDFHEAVKSYLELRVAGLRRVHDTNITHALFVSSRKRHKRNMC